MGDAVGVEHYVAKKLPYLHKLPMSEPVWSEIGELMQIQRAVQLGGPSVRIKAVDYLRGKRRYLIVP